MKFDQIRQHVNVARQGSSTLITILAILVVVAAVIAIFINDASKIEFLLKPENWALKMWFLLFVAIGVLSLVTATLVQTIPYNRDKARRDHESAQILADARAAEVEDQAEKARSAQRLKAVEDEIAELKRHGLKDVKAAAAIDDKTIIYGTLENEPVGGMMSSNIEATVLDRNGKKLVYVVVYLFPDSAFWTYLSYLNYENIDGEPLNFLNVLEKDPFSARLKSNQQLIGIGLESSAQEGSVYARQRAAHLCGALFALTGGSRPVYGLNFGQYTGPAQPRDSMLERRQRSVVLVGLRDIAAGVETRRLVPEILNLVAIPGVDLRNYSLANNPAWIEINDCDGPRF